MDKRIEEKVTEQLKEILELEDQDLELNDNFRDFDYWDSMANLSVIAMLDDEFNVHINAEDFKNINTVGELVREVENRSK